MIMVNRWRSKVRINTALKNMHLFCIYKGVKGFVNFYNWGKRMNIITKEAKRREEIVKFFEKYGLKPTIDAYKVSKSTIYDYQKKLKESGGRTEVLNPKSKAPKNKRAPKWDERIIEFIKSIRCEYGDLGEKKIKPLLNKYCKDNNITKVPSAPTIGRIIKKNGLYFHKEYTHFGKMKKIKRNKKLRRKGYRPFNAGDLVKNR